MSKIIYKNTEYGIGGSNSIELTQAQYNSLVEAGQVKENVTYYITDADEIDASEIVYKDTTVDNELDELNKNMNNLIIPFDVTYTCSVSIPANTTKTVNVPRSQIRNAVPAGYKLVSYAPLNYLTHDGYTGCYRSYSSNDESIIFVYNHNTSAITLTGITLTFLAIRSLE